MKQLFRAGLMAGFFFMASLAVAQPAAEPAPVVVVAEADQPVWAELVELIPGVDLAAWGLSAVVTGGIIMLVVEFLKTRIRQRWPDARSSLFTLLSFLVSAALTAMIFRTDNLTDPTISNFPFPLNLIVFWFLAGSIASGWYDRQHNREKALLEANR